jgi:hypothetical protein
MERLDRSRIDRLIRTSAGSGARQGLRRTLPVGSTDDASRLALRIGGTNDASRLTLRIGVPTAPRG